jgi:hypothetical protein
MEEGRRLHNEELYKLYSSPNIIGMMKSMRMRWAKHVARMKGERNASEVLVENPVGNRPLDRPGCR